MKLAHLQIAKAARTPKITRKSDEMRAFAHMRSSGNRHIPLPI